jgi:hypothetical protein
MNKRLFLKNRPFDPKAYREQMDAAIGLFTSEMFKRKPDLGSSSKLPIFVIGMMRSGTTLAEQIISCHPEVGAAGEQPYWVDHETYIVDYRSRSINGAHLSQCANEYLALLTALSPGFPHVTDKNPANLLAAGLIHLALPNARLIHLYRNPIDTALSIWMTPMRTSATFIGDKQEIVYAFQQHARLLQHWRSIIPANRFLDVKYEELIADPEGYTRKMVAFCGLEWDSACLHPELNKRPVRTPSFWQVRQPVYKSSMDRWKRYAPWLGAFEELLGFVGSS